MNEYEELVLSLAQELHEGLMDIVGGLRLTEDKIPDDWLWLAKKLNEMSDAISGMGKTIGTLLR